MAFSPDVKLLAIANSAWDIQLINCETGREVATLPNPDSQRILGLVFGPDGSQLAVDSTQIAAVGKAVREIHLLDLRAIRRQLAEMGLDWNMPPYPPPPPWFPYSEAGEKSGSVTPLHVELDLGDWLQHKAEADLLEATRLKKEQPAKVKQKPDVKAPIP